MLSLKFMYDSAIGSLITGWKRKRIKGLIFPAIEDPTLEDDPFRATYVQRIPQAQLFKGVLIQGYLVPSDVLIDIENMDIREDDVFVITYPKSGTTWTEEIISLIYNDADVTKVSKELLAFRVHHLEVGRPFGQHRFLRNLKSPRLMATHLPLALIPKQLRNAKCKIIYVVRNPKDTAVSYYHHHKMSTYLGNYSGTWDEFLAHFMAGHVVYGSWFDHVKQYWQFCNEHPDKVLFISYEELKMDLNKMVGNLGEFLDRNLSPESISTICDHCSFEHMKTNRMVNREQLPISDLFDMSKSKFMRKGIIGDWKNHFSPEQSRLFDSFYEEKMGDCGLDLVYEPEDAMKRLLEHGRVIYNHPKPDVRLVSKEIILKHENDHNDNSLEEEYYDNYDCIIPPVDIHIQPDPLMVDFVY